MSRSQWEELADWPPDRLAAFLDQIGEVGRATLLHDWTIHARPEQLAPPGLWRVWLMLAGRGFGKTRAGAEWVRAIAEADGAARIALVGATLHEARSVMVEGESGLLAIAPWWDRPVWNPALRRLIWKSGAQAMLFGAADPETLRGPQFSHGWADEIAKWAQGEAAWDNLMMGVRLGLRPRVLATTTPRPVPLVRRLVEQAGVVVTRGATRDNRAHLPDAFLAAMERDYGGTALGRQELEGELIAEPEGALWTRALIERCRVRAAALAARGERLGAGASAGPGAGPGSAARALIRIVVAVDPPASSTGDACGIIVAGLGRDGRGYVIEDGSIEGASPERWAAQVAAMAARGERLGAGASAGPGAGPGSAARALIRIVVAVDPPASSTGDACGIIVAGLGRDGRGYVIEDGSIEGASPERWAAQVAAMAARHGADRVVAEANNGGEMVAAVLRAAQAALPLRLVHASRGKSARAEPVAALYESGRVHHLGAFPELEDQMCAMLAAGGYCGPGRSPDRADALVWALTDLMLGKTARHSIRSLW